MDVFERVKFWKAKGKCKKKRASRMIKSIMFGINLGTITSDGDTITGIKFVLCKTIFIHKKTGTAQNYES